MNRRSFLRSLIAAPIAAAVAPMAAKQAYVTGGVVHGPVTIVGEHVAGQWAWVGHVGPEVVVPYWPTTSEIRRLFSENGAETTRSAIIYHDPCNGWSEWLDTPVEAEHLSKAIPMGMTGC